MGIVQSIQTNINNEVTGVEVLKGKTREIVKRHASTIIPLLSIEDSLGSGDTGMELDVKAHPPDYKQRPKRKAALQSRQKTKDILNQ